MKRYVPLLLTFVVGTAVGWVVRDNKIARDYTESDSTRVGVNLASNEPIVVRTAVNEHNLQLTPINYQVGDSRTKVLRTDFSPADEKWFIQIGDVLIACIRSR